MKNWKTTVLGIIAGTLTILQATLQSGVPVQWLNVALGIVIMALGLVMKDFNVTGGTVDASKKAVITTLASLMLLLGCASTQMVSATTSTGHNYPYCLEAIFKLDPLQADTLFCGGFSEVQRQFDKLRAQNPDVRYEIVPQRKEVK